jgi:hypothetical protein
MKHFIFILLSACSLIGTAQNKAPKISNLTTTKDGNAYTYNFFLHDPEYDVCELEIFAYLKDGKNLYPVAINAIGDIGKGISPGFKSITWTPTSFGDFVIKIVARDDKQFDIQKIVDQVDTINLLSQLKWIEGTRHRSSGPVHLAEMQDSLTNLFSNIGLDTTVQTSKFGNYTLKNIIGNQHGAGETNKVYINDAHYDSVANGPGGDDNGSGVAGVMEIARILSGYHFDKTIRFIGFDLEEDGLIGSNTYVNKNGFPTTDTIEGVLNFEMIGYYSEKNNSQTLPTGFNLLFPEASAAVSAENYKGNFITNVGNVASKSLNTAFKEAAAEFVPDLRVISIDVPGTGTIAPDLRRSDHATFWDANKPALMLTDGANFRNKNYHTANDKVDSLNIRFMGNVVKATLATMIKGAGIIHGDVYTVNESVTTSTTTLPESALIIYPNPFKNNLKLQTDIRNRDFTLSVQNLAGLEVYKNEVLNNNQPEIEIKTKVWPSGIYLLTLRSGNGMITRKVVKE